jgi:hypothetical protein
VKLIMYDDASTPAGNSTASQLLVQKRVLGILDDTSFPFGGAATLTKDKIRVTGASIDGPEWGESNNMFSVVTPTETPVNGSSYTVPEVIFTIMSASRSTMPGMDSWAVTRGSHRRDKGVDRTCLRRR